MTRHPNRYLQYRLIVVCLFLGLIINTPAFSQPTTNIGSGVKLLLPTKCMLWLQATDFRITLAEDVSNDEQVHITSNSLTANGRTDKKSSKKVILWLIGIALFDLIILIVFIIGKHRAKSRIDPNVDKEDAAQQVYRTADNYNTEKENIKTENAIYLFGEFRFFNSEGEECSSRFSPLLKELFLVIIIHSLHNKKGISTSALSTLLWPDMELKNARNNLSVNIGKLRNLLGSENQHLLINDSGSISFNCVQNDDFYCDLSECINILSHTSFFNEDIKKLLSIIQPGGLLQKIQYEWLDDFKSKISNHIIDWLTVFSESNSSLLTPNLQIQIANALFNFDMINEKAMELKCRALTSLGKHSLAKETYTKFIKEYKTLYDIDFERSFKSITE